MYQVEVIQFIIQVSRCLLSCTKHLFQAMNMFYLDAFLYPSGLLILNAHIVSIEKRWSWIYLVDGHSLYSNCCKYSSGINEPGSFCNRFVATHRFSSPKTASSWSFFASGYRLFVQCLFLFATVHPLPSHVFQLTRDFTAACFCFLVTNWTQNPLDETISGH